MFYVQQLLHNLKTYYYLYTFYICTVFLYVFKKNINVFSTIPAGYGIEGMLL